MKRRITHLWSFLLTVRKKDNKISMSAASGIGARGETLERLASHDLHALHPAPSNLFLLETVLNPAAQFTRGVILPPRDCAKLQPQRGSGRPERFHTQRPRPVH